MRSPGASYESAPSPDTVLDAYFAESTKGPEHRRHIATQMWRLLSPAEKTARQQEAREIAADDLALGAEYTQDVLLLEYVNQRATVQEHIPMPRLPEVAAEPATSDGGALELPPAT